MILPLAGGGSTFLGTGTGTTSSGFLGGSGTSKKMGCFWETVHFDKAYIVVRLKEKYFLVLHQLKATKLGVIIKG